MKHVLLLIAAICALILAVESKSTKEEWKMFKTMFNKTYETSKEELKRYKIFKLNSQNIKKHNQRYEEGEETYLQEVNRFADLTENEFAEFYGVFDNQPKIKYNQDVANTTDFNTTDGNLDWREEGGFTPVKDQGRCGSCWIFSVVDNLESYYFRKTGVQLVLSEQHVIDCLSNTTCSGGNPGYVFLFVAQHGINLEIDYPFKEKHHECQDTIQPRVNVTFDEIGVAEGTDEDLRLAMEIHGPLTTCLYVTPRWMFYKSGVWYHNECAKTTNHCVIIVGYGSENGNDYWLIRNSWGNEWGMDGYIKVARNKHKNYCGLSAGLYIL